jgi:IS30 family transposase
MAHLTRSKRDQIEILLRAGKNQPEIATLVGCAQSTVSRELSRWKELHPRLWYEAEASQAFAEDRRSAAKERCDRWYDDPAVLRYVIERLRERKSPEQIAGRMRRESPWHRANAVCAKSIYTYIWKIAEEGGCLHLHLRRRGKRTKWFGFGKPPVGIIPGRRDISERPKVVDGGKRAGDWESDLVVGGSAVATFVERFSKYFRAIVLADQGKDEFLRAAQEVFEAVPVELRKTLTHDNGREICCHQAITEDFGIVVYCARPYHAWERGLNEHTNGLLRDFFPKGTDFRTVSQEELDHAVDLINNRPRRSLNYRTPAEVLESITSTHYAFQSTY